jgi:hypothetical protein
MSAGPWSSTSDPSAPRPAWSARAARLQHQPRLLVVALIPA